MADDRPLRFTDSPQHGLTSTMSTTSGLGSNYTNTSGITLPPTPSPRRKLSTASFNEMAEMQPAHDNRTASYYTGKYLNNYREPLQTEPMHRNYMPEDYVPTNDAGYFGKKTF